MVMWTNVCITTIEKRAVNGMVNCKSVEEEMDSLQDQSLYEKARTLIWSKRTPLTMLAKYHFAMCHVTNTVS